MGNGPESPIFGGSTGIRLFQAIRQKSNKIEFPTNEFYLATKLVPMTGLERSGEQLGAITF